MKLVVDASVAIKWLLDEAGSAEARGLVRTGTDLIGPELLLIEVANALWKSARLGRVAPNEALAAIVVLPPAFRQLYPVAPLIEPALELSLRHEHPVYDCIYLALAERESARFVTADARLIALAAKRLIANVVPLGAPR